MRFLSVAALLSTALAAHAQEARPEPLCDFVKPPAWSFLGWEKKLQAGPDGLRVAVRDGKGGFGYVVARDLSRYAEYTPAVILTAGNNNQADTVRLTLQDADGTEASYFIKLGEAVPGDATHVLAADGASLREPAALGGGKQAGMDLANVANVVVVGDWKPKPLDLVIKGVELVPPTPAIQADREKLRQRLAREAERNRIEAEKLAQRKAALIANSPHPADGAWVTNVAPVAADILGIEIQSGAYIMGARVPYSPQPDDVVSQDGTGWVVRAGQLVQEPLRRSVSRKDPASGRMTGQGVLSFDGRHLLTPARFAGTPLDTLTIDELAAYEISSVDDAAYAAPRMPVAVHRKSKPNSPGVGNNYAIQHRLYLKLPAPLKTDAVYTVRFKGINTRDASVSYKHVSPRARSEAIHVPHTGYRADDPFKRGYLSIWLGTGGGYEHRDVTSFEILDEATGKPVFSGTPELTRPLDTGAGLSKDYTLTAVHALDFSGFRQPGRYRLHVPGIGCSFPFAISDDVWEKVMKTGLLGVLSQRSGIALEPPFIDFLRPRPSHPDDGVKFYQINARRPVQEDGRGEDLLAIWKTNGRLEEVTGIWGGYQDAGDWDTYSTSLHTADLLLEAFEISTDYFGRTRLSLPPQEASDRIPDLLNEALWGLAVFRRLQMPDGAVRNGFGDAWGARACDVSWDDSNPVCVLGPSADISWYYAAVAARMARALAKYDADDAQRYGASAVKAWQWAAAQDMGSAYRAASNRTERAWLRSHAREAAAAVALYALTAEASYHDRYKELCETIDPVDTVYKGGHIEPLQQADATFAYARLPDNLADPALKRNARDLYVLAGNVAKAYVQQNPYNLATVNSGYPMFEFCAFFTMAGMGPQVVRAHALTGDPEVLKAVVASTGFGLGANPDNMSFTTGLGPNPVRYPLKLDSIRTGQPAPAGITVYGPSDQRTPRAGSRWVYQWVLPPTRMVPGVHSWPPAESYVDVYSWPAVNEYCVNAPLTITAYTWCYLAGRSGEPR